MPDTEERLRWSFIRFIDAAAKKYDGYKLIFVLDGVNRIRSEDMPTGSLKWLPMQFPPNVRFILSSKQTKSVEDGTGIPSKRDSLVNDAQHDNPGAKETSSKQLHRTFLEVQVSHSPIRMSDKNA